MRLAVLSSHPIQYHAPLFRELARRIEVHVFFAHRASPLQQANAGFGTAFDWDVDLTSGYPHSFLHNIARTPSANQFAGCDTPEIGERLRKGGFGAVLALGWHLKSMLQGISAAKRLGLPVLVRGDSQLSTPRSVLKRLLKECVYPIGLRAFNAALYVGERSRDYYRHYGVPERRLFFSPHCVDTKWFADRATMEARQALRRACGIADGASVVLFAGKLLPFKRPLDVVLAVARGKQMGAELELLVAGAGELERAIRDAASAYGVRLHMLGFQNQTQMPAAYAAADMLALPSDGNETWGLVGNEALACGRPIIVSDACGCAPDLAADGTVGQVFPLTDVAALARSIIVTMERPPSTDALRAKSNCYTVAVAVDGIMRAIEVSLSPIQDAIPCW